MAILDNVPEDPSPLVVTLDFNKYLDGAKLSSLARSYFASKGPKLGVSTMEDYFATLLLINLKQALETESVESVYNAQIKASEELAAAKVLEVDQIKVQAAEQLIQIKQDIEAVALVKK
jgi:hypothetical protein